MITFAEATRIVSRYFLKEEQDGGEPLVILEEHTIEKPFGWVFFYNSKKFIETGEFKYRLAGNAPVIIDRESGEVHETGTAYPIEHYIKEYEKSKG